MENNKRIFLQCKGVHVDFTEELARYCVDSFRMAVICASLSGALVGSLFGAAALVKAIAALG